MRILVFLAVCLSTTGAFSAELNVYAAASLTASLQQIGAAYEEQTGDKIIFNFAASSTLARQIQEGAPADLFFSADEAKMDSLEKSNRLLPGTRKSLLSNTLVIVANAERPAKLNQPQDLAQPSIGRIALAEPQTVPAGIYAKQYLQKAGLWAKVIDKVIPTENVRAALAAVESGNVDVGIVYKTDATISKKVVVVYEVPVADSPKISYPVAVLKSSQQSEPAKLFLAHLESEEALQVFAKYGFLIAR